MWLFIIINGIACFFIGAALGFAGKKWYRLLLLVSSPFLCAYILYWLLVFARGGDQSGEFAAWSGVYIIAWAIPGYLPLLLGYALGKRKCEEPSADLVEFSSPRSIRLFGLLTIIFWLSFALYLPPCKESPNVGGVVDESYEIFKLEHPEITKTTLEKELLYDIYIGYAKELIFIILGVIAGFFMVQQKLLGRNIALTICIVLLGSRLFSLFRSYPHIFDRLKALYVFLLPQTPLPVIHKDIIAPVFFIFSIVYLLNRTVVRKVT